MHRGTQHTRVCREDIDINRLTGSRSTLLLAANLDIASVQVASAELSEFPSSCLDCCPIEQNSWERAHIDVRHSPGAAEGRHLPPETIDFNFLATAFFFLTVTNFSNNTFFSNHIIARSLDTLPACIHWVSLHRYSLYITACSLCISPRWGPLSAFSCFCQLLHFHSPYLQSRLT
jgi:hypothetical protein